MSEKINLKRMLAEIAEDEANEPRKTALVSQEEIKAILARRERGSTKDGTVKSDPKQ